VKAGLARLAHRGRGNGILLDFHVMRHMADIEALQTYEGTETMQTLIAGRDITGVGPFT
jgi:glutaryl-CoA dehydrogenase